MRPAELSQLLKWAIPQRFPILIKGAPGVGKTDIVFDACSSLTVDAQGQLNGVATDLILSHPVVSDPTDFKGLPADKKDGTAHFLPYGDLAALMHAVRPTVFFLDDLGQASASVQAACMQLILARRINGHKVSDLVTFIAATNRKSDKAGVSGILEPVKSRFKSIIELEPNNDDWCRWAIRNNMPVELIGFIRFKPELLWKFEATKEIVNTPSPRTVANVGSMQNAVIPQALEFEVFQGAAGETFAIEYSAFLKMYRGLPDMDQIVLNPTGTAIPAENEPGIRFALAGALAARMNDQNLGNIITYLKRLGPEIQVASLKDGVIRHPEITKTKAFVMWSTDNANTLL